MTTADAFLAAVLGPGAAPVARVAAEPVYAGYVVPRVVRAWLGSQEGFSGCLPGTTVAASLRKTEAGWGGQVDVDGAVYQFSGESIHHATAAVAAALGSEFVPVRARDVDLARLGKTLDALVKAAPRARGAGEAPGPAAKPSEKIAPEEKAAPEARQPSGRRRLPLKPPAPVKLTMSETEAAVPCKVCDQKQVQKGKWVGCSCVRGLDKSEARRVQGGYEVSLAGWSESDVTVLHYAIGRTR